MDILKFKIVATIIKINNNQVIERKRYRLDTKIKHSGLFGTPLSAPPAER